MDIVLQTNSENPVFSFRDVERFDDGSGYATRLEIRSGWVSVDYPFHFEPQCLGKFLTALESLDRTLAGTARLKPLYEEQFVEFQGNGQGHITVRGELVEDGVRQQRVHFAFGTDQTCLRPLIIALRTIST